MFKYIVAVILVLAGISAHANLEVAGIVGAANTHFSSSGSEFEFKDSWNTKIGVLGFFPIFPGLSIRTGIIHQTRKMKGQINSAVLGIPVSDSLEDQLLEVPLNVQMNLPFVDIYVFGGLIYSMTQSSSFDSDLARYGTTYAVLPEKTKSDLIVNLGAGYNIISYALFRWAVELELQQGTANLATMNGAEIKQSSYGLNTIFAIGF